MKATLQSFLKNRPRARHQAEEETEVAHLLVEAALQTTCLQHCQLAIASRLVLLAVLALRTLILTVMVATVVEVGAEVEEEEGGLTRIQSLVRTVSDRIARSRPRS
jgi:hypothetical protein